MDGFEQSLFWHRKKRCPYCGKDKDISEFGICRSAANGVQSYCKACQRLYHLRHPSKEYKVRKKDKSLEIW